MEIECLSLTKLDWTDYNLGDLQLGPKTQSSKQFPESERGKDKMEGIMYLWFQYGFFRAFYFRNRIFSL